MVLARWDLNVRLCLPWFHRLRVVRRERIHTAIIDCSPVEKLSLLFPPRVQSGVIPSISETFSAGMILIRPGWYVPGMFLQLRCRLDQYVVEQILVDGQGHFLLIGVIATRKLLYMIRRLISLRLGGAAHRRVCFWLCVRVGVCCWCCCCRGEAVKLKLSREHSSSNEEHWGARGGKYGDELTEYQLDGVIGPSSDNAEARESITARVYTSSTR